MKLITTSLITLFAASGLISGAYAQPVSSRLTAVTAYTNQGGYLVPSDSQKYNYPSGYTRLDSMVNRFAFYVGQATPYYNYAHTYDASGFLAGETTSIWNAATATFKPSARFQYVKDAMGNLVEKTYQNWVASTMSYSNTQHYTYARDAKGNIIEYVQQIWDGPTSAWRNVSRDSNTYNAQNMVTRSINQNWNNTPKAYFNNFRHDYTYDASGTGMLSDTMRLLDVPTGGWRDYGITTYTLNAARKPVNGIMVTWSTSTNVYGNYERYAYSYDAAGREISKTVEVWNPTTAAFANSYQDARTFNAFNQIKTLSHNYWNGSAFGIYASSSKTIYYYENYVPAAVSPQHADALALSLSPNPVKDVLTIQLQSPQDFTATISDMQGRIYQKFFGVAVKDFGINISVAEMPAGNYIVSVNGKNGIGASRIISVTH